MRFTVLLFPVAMVGCGVLSAKGDDTGLGAGSNDTMDTDDGGTGDVEGEADGTCEGYTVDAASVEYDLVYSGDVTSDAVGDTVEGRLFDSEAEWLGYLDTFTGHGAIADVDFDTQWVATGLVRVMDTCGLAMDALAVTQASGEPVHVDITVTDSSGGCDTACAEVGSILVAVAVQRDDVELATVCARRGDEC